MSYYIEEKLCVDCAFCKFLCHFDAIEENEKHVYEINAAACKSCGQCADGCPNNAIKPSKDNKFIKTISINKEKCKGCSLCAKKCPVKAIDGVLKTPYIINPAKCIKCGVCAESCKLDAVDIVY